jgi:uncharacterized protein YcfJ
VFIEFDNQAAYTRVEGWQNFRFPSRFQESIMKKLVLLAALAAASGAGMAQEIGRVISSTPVINQVAVPRQVCSTQQVTVPGQKSGGGALLGGIAGGAIGNNLGGGEGRALATVIGLVGGAMMGDRLEGGGQPQTQNVQSCTTQTFYENRTTAYNVVYEFNGKQYTVQMPQDPGPSVRLQVTPVGGSAAPQQGATTNIPQDMGTPAPVQTVAAVPAVVYTYPGYYYRPYYSPGVNFNLGWYGGHRHWR